MDPAVVEFLRERHKPAPVRVLFVGESAPAGETFFYTEDSILYSETRAAFERAFGPHQGDGVFLGLFERLDCYLDDLCLQPVNRLPDPERQQKRLEAVEPLAARLRNYAPDIVVAIGKTTAGPHVLSALQKADLTNIPFHRVAFPGRPKHKILFHREMDSILRSIDWDRPPL